MEQCYRARRWGAHYFLVLVFSLLHSAAHSAAVLVSEERSVRSSGNVGSQTSFQAWTVEERSPETFGDFNFTVNESRVAGTNLSAADASMTSSITETSFSASANTGGTVTLNESSSFFSSNADSRAFFAVTFQVLSPTLFDLTGSLAFSQDLGFPRGSAFLSLFDGTFSADNFSIFLGKSSSFNSFSQNIQLSGLLEPDTYTLRAQASVDADGFSAGSMEIGTATFDFTFLLDSNGPPATVSAVPVPAAVWLFSSALGLLGWTRRRPPRS